MNMYGGGLVVRTLKRFGVKHLFSLPGHQTLSIFDACKTQGLDMISTRHEASAVYMAQALALGSRQPGVAVLAGGPELTNALTGLAQAQYAHMPLVVISGSNTLRKRDRGFPQDMDQLQVVRPFTKWARSCHAVERIPEYIETAFRHAMRGRPGPTYVEIPYDVMESKINADLRALPEAPLPARAGADPGAVEELGRLLKEAKRPVVVAGSGVFWSHADEALLEFVRKTGLPLFLSNAALAMPWDSNEYFGIGSPAIARPAFKALTEADLILLLGTRINFLLGFGQPPFISSRQKVVQIDVEPEEIGSNRRADLAIAGDIRMVLQAFNARESGAAAAAPQAWRRSLEQEIHNYDTLLNKLAQRRGRLMHPLRLVMEVEACRTDDSMLVLDGANSILWALMAVKPHPQGALVVSSMGELEAIGAGVPQALSLKRAYPDRQVILHTGDGSFGYGAMEMETAVRYGIPIVVVIHNDAGWGMTRDMHNEFFGRNREHGNQLGVVHYERVVEAMGGHGEFVEKGEEVRPALERAMASGKPACVNVMVDPKPRSPGLQTFMLMEVMLGKQTALDSVPAWMRRLRSTGLDRTARAAMLRYLDRSLHSRMKG